LRKNQLIALFDDAPKGGLALAAREHQRRDQDVRVEDDLQERR
jgi:hypothetical protein